MEKNPARPLKNAKSVEVVFLLKTKANLLLPKVHIVLGCEII